MTDYDLNSLVLVPDTDKILTERMPLFDDFGDAGRQISIALERSMIEFRGIGMAANQVGLRIRAFAAIIDDRPMTLFNPVIADISETSVKIEEGCLSFPGLGLDITRPDWCVISFQDSEGIGHTRKLDGMEARCMLHEIDHLNGVVFTSKVSRLRLEMMQKKMRKAIKKHN